MGGRTGYPVGAAGYTVTTHPPSWGEAGTELGKKFSNCKHQYNEGQCLWDIHNIFNLWAEILLNFEHVFSI